MRKMPLMPPGLIWLASFPKSGNTWLRILLANLLAGEDDPVDINALPIFGGFASSRAAFEEVTLLDSGLLSHEEVDVLRPSVCELLAKETNGPYWVKVHDAYTQTAQGEPILGRGVARAAIYIVRDPRDVAVSLAYFFNIPLDKSISLLNAPDSAIQAGKLNLPPQLRQKLLGWSGHVSSWLEQRDIPTYLLRYEDLNAVPMESFRAVLDFLGWSADPDEINCAVSHSTFSKLQDQERIKGFKEHPSKGEAPFFRTGKVGSWRNHLTEAQVKAIEQVNSRLMVQLGYLPS